MKSIKDKKMKNENKPLEKVSKDNIYKDKKINKLNNILNKKEESNKAVDVELEKKYNQIYQKQGTWLLIILMVVIGSLFLSFWISVESKKFDYIGLTFQKEYFGQIPIYTTHLQGYGPTGQAINTKINLRNDPRKSEIPVIGTVRYVKDQPVYLSLNMSSNIYECGPIALVSLGQFMSGTGFTIVTGISDEVDAKDYKKPYVTCENQKESTVLVLTKGDKSEIRQLEDNPNCYVLSVNNCEIVEVVERLEVASLASFNNRKL